MTVASETNRVSYTGAGSVGPFAVPYYFLENDDLKVVKTEIATGVETVLVLLTDYTVSGAGEAAGGSITMTVGHGALASTHTITIIRDPDALQIVDYSAYGAFPAETHERALDKLTMLVQRVKDLIARCMYLSDGISGVSAVIPTPVADMLLGWNATATAIVNKASAGLLTVTAYITTLLAAADASAARTVLGIPTMVPPTQFLRKNVIIGGDFSTNPWQRGTGFNAMATATKMADRWIYSKNGSMVQSSGKSAVAPTVAECGRLVSNSMFFNVTTIDAAIAAGEYALFAQPVEGYDFLPLAQKSMTLSFWHKHVKTGTYCVSLRNSGLDRSFVAEYTQAVSDVWEKAVINIPASPSAGTWDYTTGAGLYVGFVLACGSTFQTTAGSWQTGHFLGTANQVNGMDSLSNEFRFALIQLEAGDVATPFEDRSFETEYALCRRYYQKSFPIGTAPAQNSGVQGGSLRYTVRQAGANQHGIMLQLDPPMRAVPTMTTYSVGAATADWYSLSRSAASGANSFPTSNGANNMFLRNAQLAADAVGETVGIHWTADAEI